MASDPPDDVLHFRGKTLTPESPRPLYFPEPSNIPLLSQIDPVYNDTSTLESASETTEVAPTLVRVSNPAQLMEQYARIYSLLGEKNDGLAETSAQETATSSLPAVDQAETQETKNEVNVPAAHALLSASLFSSTMTATSAQETAANEFSSTNGALNHPPPPSDSYQVEIDPSSTSAGPAGATHTAAFQQDQTVQNHDQSTSHEPDNGINFQTLLDNLCQPPAAALAPSDANAILSNPATDSTSHLMNTEFSPSSSNLPPRPPPQEKPAIHPNYSLTDDIRSFHNVQAQQSNGASHGSQSNHIESAALPAGAPDGPALSSNQIGIPPSSHQTSPPNLQVDNESGKVTSEADQNEGPRDDEHTSDEGRDDEAPWGPEIQKKYDEFLHDERIYVTEGVWDRFASGSRLFVGNLPSERVTKRDLFHLFHKYGKLAQISIKPAYGFVQFMEASSCRSALEAEQGGTIRGRKIHLEISKPQRSTRTGPEPSRPSKLRRSRSPDRARIKEAGRGARFGRERHERTPSDRRPSLNETRDDHRHRDTYRPTKSPPQGPRRDEYRSRDRSIDRHDHRNRRRSRSPRGQGERYRSTTPRAPAHDNDSELPIPRRAPHNVPNVQIIVLENVYNEFVYHIESAFRDRGLKTDVLILSPRISLQAVVRRQILEGVLAIVKLSKTNQYAGKIPLQVFDHASGAGSNVRFNEYSGLEPKIAAEVVLRARNVPVPAPNQRLPPQGLGIQPPLLPPPPPPPNPLVNQPNVANLISSLDAPTLQSLLGALQQNPAALAQQPPPPPNNQPTATTNLANLLGAITRQNNPMPSMLPPAQHFAPPLPFGQPPANPPFANETNLASLLAKEQLPQANPSQVQNIMEQLSKWKR